MKSMAEFLIGKASQSDVRSAFNSRSMYRLACASAISRAFAKPAFSLPPSRATDQRQPFGESVRTTRY